jgi:uncharacterized protein (TIGR02231 family)
MRILRAFSIVVLCLFVQAGLCLGLDIKKVVLFNDQALVSFERQIGGHLLIEAPPEMVPDSLVLTPLAGGSVRSVSVEPARTMSGKVKDLKNTLTKKQATLAILKRDQAMLEKQIAIIYDAAGSKGKATAFEKTHLADALGFIEKRVTALNNRIVVLAGKTEKIEIDIKDLQNQLNKVNQNPGYQIDITGNGLVEISYVVRAASWKPEYKVYALPGTNRITIESSVQARQSSGMDWNIKEMFVSTGKPSFGIEAPELQPWYLYKVSKRSAKVKAESYDKAPMAAGAPMEEPEAAVEATTTSYLIGAAKNIHLPGNGAPAIVKLTKHALNADFSLISIPKYSESAFLRAGFTLYNDTPLVPGSYSSFVDGVFSGRGRMKHVEPGQKMTLDLGIDEGIKVERKETQAFHDKTLVGKDRMTYSYEITIENTRKLKASITLKDQIPISREKSIDVELIKSNPEVKPDQDGILTWVLDMEPKQKKKAVFTFSIIGNAHDIK